MDMFQQLHKVGQNVRHHHRHNGAQYAKYSQAQPVRPIAAPVQAPQYAVQYAPCGSYPVQQVQQVQPIQPIQQVQQIPQQYPVQYTPQYSPVGAFPNPPPVYHSNGAPPAAQPVPLPVPVHSAPMAPVPAPVPQKAPAQNVSSFAAAVQPQVVAPNRSAVRILALGDSITYGMYGRGQHPYSRRLQQLLPGSTISLAGIPGETTQEMQKRLAKYLSNPKETFTHAVILGGTNDISYQSSAREIFGRLRQMHELLHRHHVKTVIVTIPNASFPSATRTEVNEMLRGLHQQWRNNTVLVDLAKDIPYDSSSPLWDDSLHFTAKGYDKFGELIFKAMNEQPGFLDAPFQG